MRTKLFLESTQNQHSFNVEIYRRINVDKSTLNQRGYYVDQRRDVISTYINVESTLSVCWVSRYLENARVPKRITTIVMKLAGKRLFETSSFIKKRIQNRYFLEDIATFLEHLFFIWLLFVNRKRCSKNTAKFTTKFMWTAASGISENRPCLAGFKFIDALQKWL